jgi:hypothetical protein
MIRFKWVLVAFLLVATLATAATLVAQPPRTGVLVEVTGNPNSPTLRANPPRVTICINANNCPDQVNWRAAGNQLAANETLEVRNKEGSCFAQSTFTLTRNNVSRDSGTTTCQAGTVWAYEVVMLRGGEVIAELDPEVVIRP